MSTITIHNPSGASINIDGIIYHIGRGPETTDEEFEEIIADVKRDARGLDHGISSKRNSDGSDHSGSDR